MSIRRRHSSIVLSRNYGRCWLASGSRRSILGPPFPKRRNKLPVLGKIPIAHRATLDSLKDGHQVPLARPREGFCESDCKRRRHEWSVASKAESSKSVLVETRQGQELSPPVGQRRASRWNHETILDNGYRNAQNTRLAMDILCRRTGEFWAVFFSPSTSTKTSCRHS